MANSIYSINKGINQPLTFKGFKAHYITYLAIGLVALLLIFACIFMLGIPSYISMSGVLFIGVIWVRYIRHLSDKYGQFGYLKKLARRRMPHSLRNYTRKIFITPKET